MSSDLSFKRMCAICDLSIEVTVNPDKTYTGGHYFHFDGFFLPLEYWECDSCYHSWKSIGHDLLLEETIDEMVNDPRTQGLSGLLRKMMEVFGL